MLSYTIVCKELMTIITYHYSGEFTLMDIYKIAFHHAFLITLYEGSATYVYIPAAEINKT